MLLSSPLFQDPKCHSCGLAEMHPVVPRMHPEWQGGVYIRLSKRWVSVQSPVKRAKLRGSKVVQRVSAITQCLRKYSVKVQAIYLD